MRTRGNALSLTLVPLAKRKKRKLLSALREPSSPHSCLWNLITTCGNTPISHFKKNPNELHTTRGMKVDWVNRPCGVLAIVRKPFLGYHTILTHYLKHIQHLGNHSTSTYIPLTDSRKLRREIMTGREASPMTLRPNQRLCKICVSHRKQQK